MPIANLEERRAYHREYIKLRYHEDEEYRTKHRQYVKNRDKRIRQEQAIVVAEFKKNGCNQCGEKESCCLDAHHLDSESKDFTIAKAGSMKISIPRLRSELAKCVCLCSNCHRKVHAGIIIL